MHPAPSTSASPSRRLGPGRAIASALVALSLLAGGSAVMALQGHDPAAAAISALDGPDEQDGFIADGDSVSPFADELPAISRLRPALRTAVQAAAADAGDEVHILITNGWRSERYQQALFDDAVRRYGSEEEAGRLVAPVDRSRHVTGDAVDVGNAQADSWLSRHGADYGLCQIYANEIWHFERATTPGGECPALLPDASAG
ncbi:hypothetical protein C5C18_09580 [Rathayibacter tritici]|uniref:D-alanyl-D-alanine carboxypeptidase-like core domain-containing protein n=1 Tax=Rathayibacter tritici TaxID=33888 RepID=A0A169C5J1_9MICO|nr:M15 family metallopeptidase [Rathayibacter tritici]AND17651.1 hypothetical protein A6122_2536 [Rathayibacter tritici]PPF25145.1 hypothetical protein C5C06_12550 [Rathayibacter tritici]PPG06783.1 hypothetical protein C5C18_09580 [Rathayibacter tritici]